jgi:hypothetical protein
MRGIGLLGHVWSLCRLPPDAQDIQRGELRLDTRPQRVPLQLEQPVPRALDPQGAATDHAYGSGRPGRMTSGQPLHGVMQLRDPSLRRRVRFLKAPQRCVIRYGHHGSLLPVPPGGPSTGCFTVLCLFVSEEEADRLGRLALWPLCR